MDVSNGWTLSLMCHIIYVILQSNFELNNH